MQKIPGSPSVGADIEGALVDKEGKIVPCVNKIKGTKEKPWQVPGYAKGIMLQEDNVALEFNVPVSFSTYSFTDHIGQGRRAVDKIVNPLEYTVSYIPEHKFHANQLRSKQAQLFGCALDYDAYTGGVVRDTGMPDFGSTRFFGGHVHIGGDFHCPDFVSALFLEFYIQWQWGVRFDQKGLRAKWYGRPGTFRPKPYGIEYRTPDNTWVSSYPGKVAQAAMACATYLTETEPLILQQAFRAIKWTALRDVVQSGWTNEEAERAFHTNMIEVGRAGIVL